MESNHRFLGVDQVSLPLDHGTMYFKWSHRESHPELQRAELASSSWTMTPMSLCSGSRGARTHKRQTRRRLLSKQVPHQFGWLPLPLFTKAEAVGLEPTSGCSPPPVFKTGSSSGRMASIVKLRRLESNQHEDLQSVSSCR